MLVPVKFLSFHCCDSGWIHHLTTNFPELMKPDFFAGVYQLVPIFACLQNNMIKSFHKADFLHGVSSFKIWHINHNFHFIFPFREKINFYVLHSEGLNFIEINKSETSDS